MWSKNCIPSDFTEMQLKGTGIITPTNIMLKGGASAKYIFYPNSTKETISGKIRFLMNSFKSIMLTGGTITFTAILYDAEGKSYTYTLLPSEDGETSSIEFDIHQQVYSSIELYVHNNHKTHSIDITRLVFQYETEDLNESDSSQESSYQKVVRIQNVVDLDLTTGKRHLILHARVDLASPGNLLLHLMINGKITNASTVKVSVTDNQNLLNYMPVTVDVNGNFLVAVPGTMMGVDAGMHSVKVYIEHTQGNIKIDTYKAQLSLDGADMMTVAGADIWFGPSEDNDYDPCENEIFTFNKNKIIHAQGKMSLTMLDEHQKTANKLKALGRGFVYSCDFTDLEVSDYTQIEFHPELAEDPDNPWEPGPDPPPDPEPDFGFDIEDTEMGAIGPCNPVDWVLATNVPTIGDTSPVVCSYQNTLYFVGGWVPDDTAYTEERAIASVKTITLNQGGTTSSNYGDLATAVHNSCPVGVPGGLVTLGGDELYHELHYPTRLFQISTGGAFTMGTALPDLPNEAVGPSHAKGIYFPPTNSIYWFGGYVNPWQPLTDDYYEYNRATSAWKQGKMPTTGVAKPIIIGNSIYLFGLKGRVYRWLPGTDTWENLIAMKGEYTSAIRKGRFVYTMNDRDMATYNVYDIRNNLWEIYDAPAGPPINGNTSSFGMQGSTEGWIIGKCAGEENTFYYCNLVEQPQ